jgi:hypothetical protein
MAIDLLSIVIFPEGVACSAPTALLASAMTIKNRASREIVSTFDIKLPPCFSGIYSQTQPPKAQIDSRILFSHGGPSFL